MPVRARRVSLQRTVGSKPLLTRTHRERGLLGEIIVPGLMHRRLVLDPRLAHLLDVPPCRQGPPLRQWRRAGQSASAGTLDRHATCARQGGAGNGEGAHGGRSRSTQLQPTALRTTALTGPDGKHKKKEHTQHGQERGQSGATAAHSSARPFQCHSHSDELIAKL